MSPSFSALASGAPAYSAAACSTARRFLASDLAKDADHFGEADKQLLKFHGSYQQEDRDARKNRDKSGVRKHYMFMVRCKKPDGKLTAEQYLAMDDLAGEYSNGTLRLTSRPRVEGTMQYEQTQLQPMLICTHPWNSRVRFAGKWPVKPSNSK